MEQALRNGIFYGRWIGFSLVQVQIIIIIFFSINAIIFISWLIARDLAIGNNVDLWDTMFQVEKM